MICSLNEPSCGQNSGEHLSQPSPILHQALVGKGHALVMAQDTGCVCVGGVCAGVCVCERGKGLEEGRDKWFSNLSREF